MWDTDLFRFWYVFHLYIYICIYIYNICGSWSVKKIDPETTESLHGYCVDLSQPTANLFKLLGITFLVGKKVQTVDFMAPCLSERYIHMIYIYTHMNSCVEIIIWYVNKHGQMINDINFTWFFSFEKNEGCTVRKTSEIPHTEDLTRVQENRQNPR